MKSVSSLVTVYGLRYFLVTVHALMTEDLYKRAGVEDLSEFYRTKFVSDEVLDARYFSALDRFDMRFARTNSALAPQVWMRALNAVLPGSVAVRWSVWPA